ncbi:UNKNOWN [Stylonychia lemnae]|uniref:Uncharacterized protein n=1 Tax=Stylonychia lemnae TaxID=5949 RepID=A0A078B342_STYLE|nr:UNKNOWN [Stylonychia lemnae]|eukprot:CDW87667.1 UNKNOWN [Stylonychia lemnae]
MSKKRIYVKLEGSDQLIPIAWYEGTPIISILGLIKEAFGISSKDNNSNIAHDLKMIGLYDSDGDLVVISDSIPNDQTFTQRQDNLNETSASYHRQNNFQQHIYQQPPGPYYQDQVQYPQQTQQYGQPQFYPGPHPQMYQGYPPQHQQNLISQDPYWHQHQLQYQQQHVLMTPQTFYHNDLQNRTSQNSPRQSPTRFFNGQQTNLQPPQSVRMQPSARFNQNNQQQYANLQAMGMGLRGTSKMSSNNASEQSETLSQRKVSDKRNNLKNIVAGELGFKKPGSVISSQLSSQESNDQVMSLRGFGVTNRPGSDNGDQTSQTNYGQASLLNTPLANTMKKVGMNPNLANNRLNQFLVKKGGNSSYSGGGSPLTTQNNGGSYRDGTGGPQMHQQTIIQGHPNQNIQHRPSRFQNGDASSGGFQEYTTSQFGEADDFMFYEGHHNNMGSPRSALYPDNFQNQLGQIQNRFIHSDETVSIQGDYIDMQGNNLSPQMLPMRQPQYTLQHKAQMFRGKVQEQYPHQNNQQTQQIISQDMMNNQQMEH